MACLIVFHVVIHLAPRSKFIFSKRLW
jgi:hypothetical protein